MNIRNKISLLSLLLGLGGCPFGIGPNDMPAGGKDGGADMAPTAVEPKLSSLYKDYLAACQDCHTPMALGRTAETETTLNFTSLATAFTSLTTGKAAGLKGNQMSCNGVAFVVPGDPPRSLLFAVLDENTRKAFKNMACDNTAVSDMTVKVGKAPSAAFLAALKQWIQDGAKNN